MLAKYSIAKRVCRTSTSIVIHRTPNIVTALAQSYCIHVAMQWQVIPLSYIVRNRDDFNKRSDIQRHISSSWHQNFKHSPILFCQINFCLNAPALSTKQRKTVTVMLKTRFSIEKNYLPFYLFTPGR